MRAASEIVPGILDSRPVSLGNGGPGTLVRVGAGAAITTVDQGEELFNGAMIGHKSWQSCASCHPAPMFTDLKLHIGDELLSHSLGLLNCRAEGV